MAPMTRYACTEDGCPTEDLIAYYERRAKNDLGLIIVESCAINHKDSIGYRNGAQLHNEKQAKSWKTLVDRVHASGAKIWVQLFHPGRLTVQEISGGKVVAPSAIPCYKGSSFWRPKVDGKVVNFQSRTPYEVPEELTTEEIEQLISQFENAVKMAVLAGFDGVELHGAHGYLLHQFCHTETNQREDEYGPSPHFKFIEKVVSKAREALGDHKTLSYRLSIHMVDNSYLQYNEEKYMIAALVQNLEEWGVDVFHSSELKSTGPMFGAKKSLHQLIRENTQKPIILCGGIQELQTANELIDKNEAELIAFGRNLISNPDLISNFKEDPTFTPIKFDYLQHIEKIY